MSQYNRGYGYCQDPLGRAPLAPDQQNFIVLDTVAELRAYRFSYATFPDGQLIYVKGYYAPGDGGGGVFDYHRSGTVVDDGGIYIIPDNENGYFKRLINTPEWSVLWFGVRGNGDSDDTELIQTAVDALPDDGGVLVFAPDREYVMTARVNFDGKNATVICYGANFSFSEDYTGFVVKGVVTKFVVKGGYILGDGISRDSDSSTAQVGWVFGAEAGANVQNVSVEDVVVQSTNVGIRAAKGTGTGSDKARNVWFVNCKAIGCVGEVGGVGYGLHFSQAPDSGMVNCTAEKCGRHGMYFSEGRNYTAANCVLKNHRNGTTSGAYEAFAVSRCRNVTLTNCIFDNNYTYGLNIDVDTQGEPGENVLDGVRVSNCVFRDSYSVDIQIGTGSPAVNGVPTNVSITGCTFIGRAGVVVTAIDARSGKYLQLKNNTFDQLASSATSRAIILRADDGDAYSDQIDISGNDINTAGVGIQIPAAFLTGASILRCQRNNITAANGDFNFIVPITGQTNNSTIIKRTNFEERRAADLDATPCVSGVDALSFVNSGATVVTQLDGGVNGQLVTLYFDNGNTTIQDGTNFFLAGSANFVGTAQDTLTVRRVEGEWVEMSRSLN